MQKISLFQVQSFCHTKGYLLHKHLHSDALNDNPDIWLVFVVLLEPQYCV